MPGRLPVWALAVWLNPFHPALCLSALYFNKALVIWKIGTLLESPEWLWGTVCLSLVCIILKRSSSVLFFFFLFFFIEFLETVHVFTASSLLKWKERIRGGALKGWSKGAEILESRHRPQEWMSSSPCPLLADWNYPSLCAHTSFLLQMTSFPLWNWHPPFILILLLSTGRARAPFWGVPATAINRVSCHGLANAARSHWGNPSEASYGPREMSELCCKDQSISAYRDGDISYLSPI